MAKKQPNMDNFIREKLSDYEAPGKKGDWALMNRALDAQQRRRKMLRGLLIVSSLLVVVVSSVLFISRNENKTTGDGNAEPSLLTPAPVTAPSANENKPARNDINELNNSQAPGVAEQKEGAEGNVGETKANSTGQSADKNVTEEKAVTQGENNAAAKNKAGHSTVTENDKAQTAVAKVKSKVSKKTEDINGINSQSTANKETEKAKAGQEGNTSEVAVDNTAKQPSADSANTSATTPQAEVKDSVPPDTLASQAAPKDSLKNASVKDSLKAAAKRRGFGFNLFAGVNLYRGQSRSLTDERNISPLVGLEINHSLSRHFAIGIGTWYSLQAGYNLSDTVSRVSYFLEKNTAERSILIRKQHRLYVPLTIYYIISDKHAVTGGVHWAYLVNTVGDYAEMSDVGETHSQSEDKDVKGYMDGIKSSAFSFAAGYRYSLSRRFDINIRFIQELSDSYTLDYFSGVNAAPSWSMQTFVSIKF